VARHIEFKAVDFILTHDRTRGMLEPPLTCEQHEVEMAAALLRIDK
jgi:hypothetical protein